MACSVWASALMSILLVRGAASDCGSLVLSVDPCNQGQSVAVNACVLVGNSLAIVCNVQDTSATWLSPDFSTAIISKSDPMKTRLNDMVELNFMNQTPFCLLSNATIDNVQPTLDGLDLSCRTNFQDRSHANISIVVIEDGIAGIKQIAIDLTTDEEYVDLEFFDHQDCQFVKYLISEGLCSQQDDSATVAILEPPTMSKRINVNSFSELCVSACTEEEVCTCQEIDLDGFTVTQSQELPKETSYSVLLSFSHDVLIESVGLSPHGNVASCNANNQTSKQVMLSCSDLSNSTTYSVTVQGKTSLNNSESGYQYSEFAVSLDFSTAAHMKNGTVDDNGLSGGAIAGIVLGMVFVLILVFLVLIGPVIICVKHCVKKPTTKDNTQELKTVQDNTEEVKTEQGNKEELRTEQDNTEEVKTEQENTEKPKTKQETSRKEPVQTLGDIHVSSENTDSSSPTSESPGIVGKQLFLSYEHDVPDVDHFVRELKQDLEQRGFTLLMDVDIPAGSDRDSCIKMAINNCKGLIAVITNNYVKSDTCINELRLAKAMKKKIFPVILEEQLQTIKGTYPVMSVIQEVNWVYLRPNMDNQEYSQSLVHLVSRVTASGVTGQQLVLSYEHGEPDVRYMYFVRKLKQDLKKEGFTVWMDVDVTSGSDYVGDIKSAINNCLGLIAVITSNYVKSDYGVKELKMALSSKKQIFQVELGDVSYTQSELKEILQGCTCRVRFIPNMENYSMDLARLVYEVTTSGIQPADLDTVESAAEKQLFLSYEHEPGIDGFVWKMKQYLERKGFTVWMDADYKAGSGWVHCTTTAIKKCKGFIAVITNSYIDSDYRPKEFNTAHDHKRTIFPVVHNQVHYKQEDEWFWKKLEIEKVKFDPDPPNYDHSQTLALLERKVAEKGIKPAALETNDPDPDQGIQPAGLDALEPIDLDPDQGQGRMSKD